MNICGTDTAFAAYTTYTAHTAFTAAHAAYGSKLHITHSISLRPLPPTPKNVEVALAFKFEVASS